MQNRSVFLIIIWLSLTSLACNLTSTNEPPTVIPKGQIAAAPQATLGYATQEAGAFPQATGLAEQPEIDITLYNLLNQVESDRLVLHISELVSFHTRHVNSSTTSLDYGVGAAYAYIQQQLLEIQSRVPQYFTVFPEGHQFKAYYNEKESIQRNAVAILQGTDEGAGTIVIGAHYDSRTNDLDDANGFAPGADDNGSGVAVLIELARILSTKQHRSTIIFVFFAAEEVGRQGSKAFVTDYIKRYDIPVIAMINIDTVGSWNAPDGTVNQTDIRVFSKGPNDSVSRQLARMTNFIAYNHALNLNIAVQDQIDREGRYGDHQSFEEAGYPSVRFIEALEDTPNREGKDNLSGVEPIYLVNSTKTILGVVTALADGLRPPRNITLRDAGSGTQSLHWEPVPGASRYVVALRRPNSLIWDQHFITIEPTSGAWSNWPQYESVAIAAEDANGMVGPFSTEYKIP